MNVLARVHLYGPDHWAGAERMLHELLKALVSRGHRCEVHLSQPAPTRQPYVLDGVEVFPRGTSAWQEEATKADVLVTHLENTSATISAAIAFHKPLVQVLHNTHAPTRMWASCRNDLLVYNSEWMRAELGDDSHGIVVRPPVRVADYEVPEHTGGSRVTLVNLNQSKGGVLFAQLAAVLPDVDFLGVHGAYGEQIDPRLPNTQIRPHGCSMRRVYRDTRVLLMPSAYESWGRCAIEAMCSGIPVIATATPGLTEALGGAGILMPSDTTVVEWRLVLEHLLGDPVAYAYHAKLARRRAEELDPTDELDLFCNRVEALA